MPTHDAFTSGEIHAWNLLASAGELPTTTNWDESNPHLAGNRVIALAEQIKAERAALTVSLAAEAAKRS